MLAARVTSQHGLATCMRHYLAKAALSHVLLPQMHARSDGAGQHVQQTCQLHAHAAWGTIPTAPFLTAYLQGGVLLGVGVVCQDAVLALQGAEQGLSNGGPAILLAAVSQPVRGPL